MKLLITIFLIHNILDITTAAEINSSSKTIIVIGAIIGAFVLGILLYCLCKLFKPKRKRKIRDIGKVGSRDVKKQKIRSSASASSNTSKVNMREADPLMTSSDVRLTLTTNPITLIQPSGTTTPSRVPPQTPLTPPQPQHSAIPSSTQTTLTKVSESLDSISHPTRKSTTEIIVTPEVSEEYTSHRPRPHSTIEQRDSPPRSRSSSDLTSRFSLPPTIQSYGQQSEVREFYPERTTSFESQLEQETQATRSRDVSPYRQYHEYEPQTFDTPIDPRLQTQSRGLDSPLFADAPNLQSSQQSFETSTDDPGETFQETGPGQRQRTSMPPYPAPQSPYDDPSVPSTPPERRGRPDSTYSFDDNPGSTVPGPRPLQRSTPGTSPRSRRGRRGGNR